MSDATEMATEYDFAIIGGGTAGLVVAARLTENPQVQVLVLEAGKNRLDDTKIAMPAGWTSLRGDPEYEWTLSTVPQVIFDP